MFYWLLFVVIVIVYYVTVHTPLQTWKERKLRHAKPWPVLGNMWSFFFRRESFAEAINSVYQDEKFENVSYFGFYQFMRPVVVLKDVELIKQVGIKNFDTFMDHMGFLDEDIDLLFGKNLLSLKGEKWRNMRATLSPAFTSSKMKMMFDLITEIAEQFTNCLEQKANGDVLTLEMKDSFTRFANDVIASIAFGLKVDSLKEPENEFYKMGKEATSFEGLKSFKFLGYAISRPVMRFFKIKIFDEHVSNFFLNLVMGTIDMREKNNIIRPDMIHLLMEARKGELKYEASSASNETGFAAVEESEVGKVNANTELSDIDVTAQALLFFFAGFDTISGAMCHMVNELALEPDIQKRLYDEVMSTLRECNGKITYDALSKMKYMDMVVCETLRKWPINVITDRVCNRNYELEPKSPEETPLRIYKGDVLWFPIFSIHRDAKYYPNPEKFDPERFSDENKENINVAAYIPFGIGPRNCIGSRLALLEIKTVMLYMLSKFEIVVVEKTQVPLKLHKTQFSLMAEKGFWLGFKPRS